MIKICWIFVILVATHVADQFCTTPVLQIFLSASAIFYLTIQCSWRVTVPSALLLGTLMDVSFASSGYFYTFFLPIVPVLVARIWMRHGDCGNIVMQVIPVFLLNCLIAGLHLIFTFQWGWGFSQFAYGFVYFLLSCALSTALGIIFIAFADELAGHVGMPLFSAVHKNKRG